ncbi:MAG: TIGR01440 family protein [Acutalibacteraceae bacterium]|jgi:uncharacterized protein (TIGR01440 family)
MNLEEIRQQTRQILSELLDTAQPKAGQILVVGCSSSEIAGGVIGRQSAPELARAVLEDILALTRDRGLVLAAQCCEHLNRALIVERTTAERYGLEEVCVIPRIHAGGSFATAAWEAMADPVAVESVRAHVGMDIGDTLIGMHLRPVAVPVRTALGQIGQAHVTCARTRPKLIGGARAYYGETPVR